jgi:hypothetical protein
VSRQHFALEPQVGLPKVRLKNINADFLAKMDTVTRIDSTVVPSATLPCIATFPFLHDYDYEKKMNMRPKTVILVSNHKIEKVNSCNGRSL